MSNHLRSALVSILFAGLCIALPGGCATSQDTDDEQTVSVAAVDLISAHNIHAASLSQLNARGVIELRWTDDDGKHFEQGDVELWVIQLNRTAMRVDKLGEVFIWLGSNDHQWWLFDLASEPSTLFTAPLDAALQADQLDMVSMHPLSLLDLIGVTRVQPIDGEAVQRDDDVLTLRVRSWRNDLRLSFDADTQALRGVAVLDDAGQPIAKSRLGQPKRVRVPGVNQLNWPRMYTHINITLVDVDGSVLLALNSDMSTVIDPGLAERIFDRDTLSRALQPAKVQSIDDAPSPAAAD